jgi:hypothetical protein
MQYIFNAWAWKYTVLPQGINNKVTGTPLGCVQRERKLRVSYHLGNFCHAAQCLLLKIASDWPGAHPEWVLPRPNQKLKDAHYVDDIKRFTWISLQSISATEIVWWLAHYNVKNYKTYKSYNNLKKVRRLNRVIEIGEWVVVNAVYLCVCTYRTVLCLLYFWHYFYNIFSSQAWIAYSLRVNPLPGCALETGWQK